MSNYLSSGLTFNQTDYYVHPDCLIKQLSEMLDKHSESISPEFIKSIIAALRHHCSYHKMYETECNKLKKKLKKKKIIIKSMFKLLEADGNSK